jgi:hypothetical protein
MEGFDFTCPPCKILADRETIKGAGGMNAILYKPIPLAFRHSGAIQPVS